MVALSCLVLKHNYPYQSTIDAGAQLRDAMHSGSKTRDLLSRLDAFFESTVEIPRIRAGRRQTVETLINEEALLLATSLRDEQETWNPRAV